MTGQLSQSMQIWRARDSINAMPATIISESSTSPWIRDGYSMQDLHGTNRTAGSSPSLRRLPGPGPRRGGAGRVRLRTLRGPTGPRAPGLPRCGSRPIRGGAHCRQRAAGGPPLSGRRERRLAVPPNPMVASFPGFLSRGLFPSPFQYRGIRILWPRGGGWGHVHLGLGERGLGGIGARSIKQLRAFRPPRGAHEGSV